MLYINIFTTVLRGENQIARKPRLFYVSTSATTSTIFTADVCYVHSDAAKAIVCTGRRKRMITVDGRNGADIVPSRSGNEEINPSTDI